MSDESKVLIREVEKRPVLYNSALPEYTNRELKLRMWEEVYAAVVPNWDKLDYRDQCDNKLDVQKRWRSFRDCFRREIALEKNKFKPPKRRKYIYYEQLKFLKDVFVKRKTKKPIVHSTKIKNEEEIIETTESDVIQRHIVKSTPSTSARAEKTQKTNFTEDLINLRKKESTKTSKTESFNDNDDDNRHFLLSLLPMMKMFNGPYKLDVRIAIMNAIKQVQQQQNKFVSNADHEQNSSSSKEPQSNSRHQASRIASPIPSPSESESSVSNSDNELLCPVEKQRF